MSYFVQSVGLAALLVLSIIGPKIVPPLLSHVELVAPNLTPIPVAQPVKAAARPVAKIPVAKVQPKLAALPAPKIQPPPVVQRPQRVQPRATLAEVAQPRIVPAPSFDSRVLAALPGPKAPKIVATNTFGGSSAAPTLQKVAPAKVQTGGFGDPNGVPVNAHGSNLPNIAMAGSFDLPQGGGYGNGSGGSSGIRGTVASAGFGNGIAVQGSGGRGGNAGQARLQSANFSDQAASAGGQSTRQSRAVNQAPLSVPVSIQSKPTPVYTSEARELNIEGEVLLNVVFTADGQVHIVDVLRGLGHGLDEAARHAAQGIRFTPAMRDGHPVDSNVTLHIIFQLS